jgi:hypothetical protein
VSESRVLRKKYEPTREEVRRYWRKLHNEELHRDLYRISSGIRMKKPSRMRWAGHMAIMRDEGNVYTVLVGILKEKRPFV